MKKFSPSILKKSVVLTSKLPEETILVNVDHEDLNTALSNVDDNAVKFTPTGGEPRLEMYKNDGTVVIRLTNSCTKGLHLDEAKIIAPFCRDRQSSAGGSGLGLVITKRIVENSGGRIGVRFHNDLFTVTVSFPKEK